MLVNVAYSEAHPRFTSSFTSAAEIFALIKCRTIIHFSVGKSLELTNNFVFMILHFYK